MSVAIRGSSLDLSFLFGKGWDANVMFATSQCFIPDLLLAWGSQDSKVRGYHLGDLPAPSLQHTFGDAMFATCRRASART